MMNVLMLGPSREVHGGISAVVNNLVEAGLNEQVNLIYVSTMSEGSKLHKLFVAAGAYFRFLRLLKKADIVHVNVASDSSLLRKSVFIKTAYKRGKRIIIHQHGGDILNYYENASASKKRYIDHIFNMAEKLLVLSPVYAEFFSHLVEPDRIVLMPNRIRIEAECEDALTRDKSFLFLGRICKSKGVSELLKAFDAIHTEYPKVTLRIGGIFEDKEYKQELEARKEYVKYLGWISGEAKKEALLRSYAFVLPTYFEGQGLAILEAMSYGIPAVASNVGGIPMMIKDMENGLLVEPENAEALATKIKRLIDNPNLRNELGHAAYQTVKDKFDIKQSVNELLNIYNAKN